MAVRQDAAEARALLQQIGGQSGEEIEAKEAILAKKPLQFRRTVVSCDASEPPGGNGRRQQPQESVADHQIAVGADELPGEAVLGVDFDPRARLARNSHL